MLTGLHTTTVTLHYLLGSYINKQIIFGSSFLKNYHFFVAVFSRAVADKIFTCQEDLDNSVIHQLQNPIIVL